MLALKEHRGTLQAIENELTIRERNARMDLRPYMNRSPFSVHFDFHSVFCFRLFRSMGLRHLPVVNDSNEVVGIITRKDIVGPIIEMKYHSLISERLEEAIFSDPDDQDEADDDEDERTDDGPFAAFLSNHNSPSRRSINGVRGGNERSINGDSSVNVINYPFQRNKRPLSLDSIKTFKQFIRPRPPLLSYSYHSPQTGTATPNSPFASLTRPTALKGNSPQSSHSTFQWKLTTRV